MTTHTLESSLSGPFDDETPVETLVEFYRANGYQRVDETTDTASLADQTAGETVRLERGDPENRWWTSNMTKLPAEVRIEASEQSIEIAYSIDVTGQLMVESDREFWRRELRAAASYLRDSPQSPTDLRSSEAMRAQKTRRRLLSYGITGAVVVFSLVVCLRVFGTI